LRILKRILGIFLFSVMGKQTKIAIIVLGALILIGGGLFYYHYYYQPPVNYLIPGVPYYGFYNHFFDADSSVITSVADILDYWGDERFNLTDLMGLFTKSGIFTSGNLQNFFKENGYETYRWTSTQEGGELSQIKKFVNDNKKTPVLVYQNRSVDSRRIAKGFRVVIGVLDRDKKIVVHDHDFGNNYEISYENFQKMFQVDTRAILAVWPSNDLIRDIKGPDFNKTYSNRLTAMDKVGELLIKGADSLIFYDKGDYERSVHLHRELVEDPGFSYFPPAHRIIMLGFLVNSQLRLSSTTPTVIDEVIKFINAEMLPLNNNLSASYDGWTEQVEFFKNHGYSVDKFAQPYYFLGKAYLYKEEKTLAKRNFEEALKIYPNHKPSQDALEELK